MTMAEARVPPAHTLVWPTLKAIRALGGSATPQETTERVVELESLDEDIQTVPHGDSTRGELDYRLAWARTYLKNIGALENSVRGVWRVTDLGRSLDEKQTNQLMKQWRVQLSEQRAQRRSVSHRSGTVSDAPEDREDTKGQSSTAPWDEVLLQRLLRLPPDAFERLARRLLREAGFVNVTVTGRAGDGGIDGVGVYRLSLVSFPVVFQCKRYRGSVGSEAVRNFRGAMQGRGDKGLLLTTGTFTSNAEAEATRDGAPPIDLVDGERLCALLKEFGLGLVVRPRVVEDIDIDEDFFLQL
jgi:restriction system protein